MAKQSGYLQRWENETNRLLQATMVITSQYDIDTLQIAIHQSEGWGYDRIMRLTEAWAEVRKEYRPALDYKNPAADVCQEHMDRVLKEIIRDKAELIPHAERYKDEQEGNGGHVRKVQGLPRGRSERGRDARWPRGLCRQRLYLRL